MQKMKQKLSFILIILGLLVFNSGQAQTINMQNGTFDVIAGSFYDDGGVDADYNNGAVSYTLTLNSTLTDLSGNYNRLQFNFSFFACGSGDTLFIYDGNSVNAPLIGAYSLLQSPGVFETTTRSITFKFQSDGIPDPYGLNSGWAAQFCPFYTDPIAYNLSSSTVAQTPIVSTCNATLYDSGGPTGNMGVNENNTVVFTSALATHLVAYPQFFNIGTDNLLEIFDGNLITDSNARRIGYFKNGFPPPPQIISSGDALTFKISTTTAAPGFQFNIACLPEIFTADSSASGFPGISIGQFQVGSNTMGQNQIVYDCTQPFMLLQATVNMPGVLTYDYTVDTIPYNPPFPFYGGSSIPVPTSTDDYWLGSRPLTPDGSSDAFSFSFYGLPYNACTPGTNGAISFNSYPASPAGWHFNSTIPNLSDPSFTFTSTSTSSNYKNSIFGVFQDTYPGAGNPPQYSGIYYGHQGTYPNRVFVISCYRLPLFACTSDNLSTYQIVLYEGTNIIDVYVQDRTVCASWNSGSGLIGLLNAGGNQAVVPPGRNTGTWTAHHEAWRFTPITPVNYEINWYTNSITPTTKMASNGNAQNVVNISPTETTNYIVSVQAERQDGTIYSLLDTIKVIVDTPEMGTEISGPATVSVNNTYHYSALEAVNYDTLIWSVDQSNFELLNPSGNGIDLLVNGPGNGVLKVVGQNMCGDSEELSLSITTTNSVDNLMIDRIKIVPNPTDGNVNIDFGSENMIQSIEVINYLGQIMFQQNVTSSSINLNLESFASGLYFIRFYDQNNCIGTKKIIKK